MKSVAKVFLSYASENEDKAIRLRDELDSHGIRAWFAPDELEPGEDLQPALRSRIRDSDAFLACLSEAYVEKFRGSWLQRELKMALDSEKEAQRRKIIPVRLEVTSHQPRAKVPDPLGSRAYADLSTDERWRKNLERLVKVVLARAAERSDSID